MEHDYDIDDEDLQLDPDPEPMVFHRDYGWISETDLYLAQNCGDLEAYEEERRQRIAEANEY